VKGEIIFSEMRERLSTRFNTSGNAENEYLEVADKLVYQSMNNWRTTQYDKFQKYTNNIEI
jgi:hypothetical protein